MKIVSRILVSLLVLFAGCATLHVDRPRLSRIKKVAVTGFIANQEMPQGLEWSLSGKRSGDRIGSGFTAAIRREAPHAASMYGNLVKTLKTEMGWTVSEAGVVTTNEHYREIFRDATEGWQNRPAVGADIECFAMKGIVDPWPIERMSDGERRALMQKLGVDAIAVARVDIKLEKGGGLKQLVGAGEYKPRARVAFTVWDSIGGEPVWRDLSAAGEEVEEGSLHVFGIANPKDLFPKAVLATEHSFAKLIARFRAEQG